MKTTSKLIIIAASLMLLYDFAHSFYKAESAKHSYYKAETDFENWADRESGIGLDTLSVAMKPFLVIDTVGSLSGVSNGYVEVIRPASKAMNHKIVLKKELADKLLCTPRGDTLFVTVKSGRKGFDLKVYAGDLQGVICRSNHYLSLVGVKASRFYVESVQKEIRMYDSCQIGKLVTVSNRFNFVNGCTVDELSAVDDASFRYGLTRGCLIRSHSYASK